MKNTGFELFDSQAADWMYQFTKLKPNLRIGIYGHYFPPSEKQILRRLRDKLKSDADYVQTYIVEDLQDAEEFRKDNFLKSIFALENSNINLIVLTFKGLSHGAIRELDYVLAHPQLVFKSAVLVESEFDQDGDTIKRAFTSLFEKDLAAVNFRVTDFERGDFEKMYRLARGIVTDLFYYYIKNLRHEIREPRLI
jgi:hypothetical protein